MDYSNPTTDIQNNSGAREVLGIAPSAEEEKQSLLPVFVNGPADVYKHMLWAAELTRRFGEAAARRILDENERINGDGGPATRMDYHNNELGIAIGRTARSWEEIVNRTREKIEDGIRVGGSGEGDTPTWLSDTSEWKFHSEYPDVIQQQPTIEGLD